MRRSTLAVFAAAFLALLPAHAQTASDATAVAPVTIKGHVLGETLRDFIAKRPADVEELNGCRSGARLRNADAYEKQWVAESCQRLTDALDSGARVSFDEHTDFIFTSYEFRKAKLVAVQIRQHRTEFADALKDMKARFGEPTKATSVTVANGYGATMQRPEAFWFTPVIHAFLIDSSDFTQRDVCFIEIRTNTDSVDLQAEKEASHKSVLQ